MCSVATHCRWLIASLVSMVKNARILPPLIVIVPRGIPPRWIPSKSLPSHNVRHDHKTRRPLRSLPLEVSTVAFMPPIIASITTRVGFMLPSTFTQSLLHLPLLFFPPLLLTFLMASICRVGLMMTLAFKICFPSLFLVLLRHHHPVGHIHPHCTSGQECVILKCSWTTPREHCYFGTIHELIVKSLAFTKEVTKRKWHVS